jgi:hypothetical protein
MFHITLWKLLFPVSEHRPGGWCTGVARDLYSKVALFEIRPGHRLSLQ